MDAQQKADFLSFVHDDGKGFIGIHSATITFTEWPDYGEMIGGYFRRTSVGHVRRPGCHRRPGLSRDAAVATGRSYFTTRSIRSRILHGTKCAC